MGNISIRRLDSFAEIYTNDGGGYHKTRRVCVSKECRCLSDLWRVVSLALEMSEFQVVSRDIVTICAVRIHSRTRNERITCSNEYHSVATSDWLIGVYIIASPFITRYDHKHSSPCDREAWQPQISCRMISSWWWLGNRTICQTNGPPQGVEMCFYLIVSLPKREIGPDEMRGYEWNRFEWGLLFFVLSGVSGYTRGLYANQLLSRHLHGS
jgi:hypothetical protein